MNDSPSGHVASFEISLHSVLIIVPVIISFVIFSQNFHKTHPVHFSESNSSTQWHLFSVEKQLLSLEGGSKV
jgi:hypothetical protein